MVKISYLILSGLYATIANAQDETTINDEVTVVGIDEEVITGREDFPAVEDFPKPRDEEPVTEADPWSYDDS
jgi:hypothetical protein